jgi:hypothetical protein
VWQQLVENVLLPIEVILNDGLFLKQLSDINGIPEFTVDYRTPFAYFNQRQIPFDVTST